MFLTKLGLTLIAAAVGISTSEAREVALAQFVRPHPVAFNNSKDNAVGEALRTHFEDLVRSIKTTGTLWREPPTAYHPSSTSVETDTMTSASAGLSSACMSTDYSPTWWLPPEVESRRALNYDVVVSIACEFGIPVNLLDAVIIQESGYKPWVISGAGAMGMMQIMPRTADNLGLANPWDALANIRAGARYMRQQLDRFGRVDLALAAYNAGPERRSLARGTIPAIPETVNYVRAITTNWVRLTQLGSPNSAVAARAVAANIAVRASGYREVSLTTYEGMNAENPI